MYKTCGPTTSVNEINWNKPLDMLVFWTIEKKWTGPQIFWWHPKALSIE
jgi:hypothetical protein